MNKTKKYRGYKKYQSKYKKYDKPIEENQEGQINDDLVNEIKSNETKSNGKKYQSEECSNEMSFEECELAILRHAVDENETMKKTKMANGPEVKKMIQIVENFLTRKKLICYGGTAINNILPKFAQFYDRSVEVPDYDFYSANALADAKELADEYYKAGYLDVEAKSGIHAGTYKVFVNFIPMADITFLHKELFDALSKEAITIAGIKYAPANFLRMNMYLELSRPSGDISRWEKVLKRLTLLNQYYPFKVEHDCNTVDFQRSMDENTDQSEQIYITVRDAFIEMGVVFFGGYSSALYSRYMPNKEKQIMKKIPDFDVLAEDPSKTALIVEERLHAAGFKNIKQVHHAAIGEIIPEHIEIQYGKEVLAFIYKPIACHNYNTIRIGNKEINVATIDTILSLYLAFLYADAAYYYRDRILCMAKFLFELEQHNRLEQKGLLKRFTMNCIGVQPTLESIRAEKSAKFSELRGKRGTVEYEEWFLKYNPSEKRDKTKTVIELLPPNADIKEPVVETNENKPIFSKPRRRRRKTEKRVGLERYFGF